MTQDVERAQELGLNLDKLEALRTRARREVDEGLLPSAQIAVAREGQIAWLETFGDAADTTLYPIFSCTKAITSSAAWLLIEEGKLNTQEVVADIVPEFGTNEKETVTVEQLFLHTAGFPAAPFAPFDWDDKEARYSRFSRWRLNWPIGSKFEYHPTSSMWVIAEIIERKSDSEFRSFIRDRICEPLGLKDLFVGLPEDENDRVAELANVGDALTSEDYARLGIPEPPVTEVTEEAILSFNLPGIRAVGIPGGGGVTTATDLALFYQALLTGGLPGTSQVWTRSILDYGLKVISGDYFDPMTGKKVNRALGLVVAGDADRNFRGFGYTNSEDAFGHGGAGGQIAWADPANGLSFVYLTNGHDRNPLRMGRRGVSLSNRAAVLANQD